MLEYQNFMTLLASIRPTRGKININPRITHSLNDTAPAEICEVKMEISRSHLPIIFTECFAWCLINLLISFEAA